MIVAAALAFQIVGVSLADANNDNFKLGVRQAVASACSPALDLARVGTVTITALSLLRQQQTTLKQQRQLASSISVSVSILAPANSGTSAVMSQLQTITSTSLYSSLTSALSSSYSIQGVAGVVVTNNAPTSAPTVSPVASQSAAAPLPASSIAIIAVLGGVAILAAVVFRQRIFSAVPCKDRSSVTKVSPNTGVIILQGPEIAKVNVPLGQAQPSIGVSQVAPAPVTQDTASIHVPSDASAARSAALPPSDSSIAPVAKPRGKPMRELAWDEDSEEQHADIGFDEDSEGETRKPEQVHHGKAVHNTQANLRRNQQEIDNLKSGHSLGEKVLDIEMAAKQDEAHRKLEERLHRMHHPGSDEP